MKKLSKGLLVAGAMIAANSAAAFVDNMCPVVGIDYQHVWMESRASNFDPTGGNGSLTSKSFPGATVYLGTRFCEYLGAEFGWDWAAKRSRNTTLTVPVVGTSLPVTAKVKRQGGHFDIYTYLPAGDCFELMLGTGIGYVTAKTQLSSTNSTFVNLNRGDFGTFKPKGTVGRIRLGGNYLFDECIGVRALLGWESTGGLKFKSTPVNGVNYTFYPFKDSWTAALGLFYKF